jgi:hypothetical protein
MTIGHVVVALVLLAGIYAVLLSICQALDLWTHTREIAKQARAKALLSGEETK